MIKYLSKARRSRSTRDEGVVAVFVAILAVALFATAAVAVDLTQAYSSRRKVQAAVDAASLSGASLLSKLMYPSTGTDYPTGPEAAALDAQVRDIAINDGAQPGVFLSCTVHYVLSQPPVGQSCAAAGSYTLSGYGMPDGVNVAAGRQDKTFFAAAIGISRIDARNSATAVVKPLKGGHAPYAMCATTQTSVAPDSSPGTDYGSLLVTNGAGQEIMNPAVVGHWFEIFNNGSKSFDGKRCGLGSKTWSGLIQGVEVGGGPIILPNPTTGTSDEINPVLIITGNPVSLAFQNLAALGSCGQTFGGTPCYTVVPVCTGSNNGNGSNGQLHCDVWAAVALEQGSGKKQIVAQMIGLAFGDGTGEASSGDVSTDPNGVRVVRLIV